MVAYATAKVSPMSAIKNETNYLETWKFVSNRYLAHFHGAQ